jgi:integrase
VSLSRLPSSRWRAQVYDPTRGHNVSVSRVLGGSGTFATKAEAKRAREQARERLGDVPAANATLAAFWARWTNDPLFARPKESTNIHNRERTRAFVERYGSRPMDSIADAVVAEWLAGGVRNGTVPALRAMFNDAASAKGGRVVSRNPFARLGISSGSGRRDEQPPSEEQVWKLIRCARELATPSFAAWLQVAAFSGLRPGELDALRRANVDLDRSRIRVMEQFSAATRTFTLPKNGQVREAPLTGPARKALLSLPVEREFCFAPIRGEHWTPRHAPTTGRRSGRRRGGRGACIWRPGISPAHTWSTCSSCRRRTWRSRSGTPMAASWSVGSMGTATATVRLIESPPPTSGRPATRR